MNKLKKRDLITRLNNLETIIYNEVGGWAGGFEVELAGPGGLCEVSCQDGFDGFHGPFTQEELDQFLREELGEEEYDEEEVNDCEPLCGEEEKNKAAIDPLVTDADKRFWCFFNGTEYVTCESFQEAVETCFSDTYSYYGTTPWEDFDKERLKEICGWVFSGE